MNNISITQDHECIEIRIPGEGTVLGLRLVAAALGAKGTISELKVSKGEDVTSLRLHMPREDQAAMLIELQRVVAPSGNDHEELFALENWVRANHEEDVKRHWRVSSAAAELSARLLCVLEIMHTLLDNPDDFAAALAEWRRRCLRIAQRIGS